MALLSGPQFRHDPCMSDDTESSWDEFGNKLNGLGLKLKLHLEQASDEDGDDEIADALRKLASSVEDAFEGLRNAATDPAIKADVRDVGATFARAVSKTFADLGQDVRDARRRKADD